MDNEKIPVSPEDGVMEIRAEDVLCRTVIEMEDFLLRREGDKVILCLFDQKLSEPDEFMTCGRATMTKEEAELLAGNLMAMVYGYE